MASSGSGGATTLSRWRPAILVIIGLTAAYGIYQVHTTLYSTSATLKDHQLRRRNAVHRSNIQRPAPPVSTDLESQNDPLQHGRRAAALAQDALENLETVYSSGMAGSQYGVVAIELASGARMNVTLHPRTLPSQGQLSTIYDTDELRIQDVRNALEAVFLDAFLDAELSAVNHIPTRVENYLATRLSNRGIQAASVRQAIERYNSSNRQSASNLEAEPRRSIALRQLSDNVLFRPASDNLDFPEEQDRSSIADDRIQENIERITDMGLEDNDLEDGREDDQELLGLLFNIAEDKARRDGYVHRGVTCNSCDMMPIRGIRYRCSNCLDYDLCETCEAQQVHYKTHLMYKVRIPAPFIGNPRQAQPVCYPGKPSKSPSMLLSSKKVEFRLMTAFEFTELDGLWDQFKCLAATEWPSDPHELGMAINRRTFDKSFISSISVKPPPPNLLYDRMFAYYDTNNDGLIGFEEFITGLSSLRMKGNPDRTKRIFNGYDLDRDGYVNRRDVLRMFRAFYALSKELSRDSVVHLEEEYVEASNTRELIEGSQPLSSAFTGPINPGEASRIGDGKELNENGDLQALGDISVVRENEEDSDDPQRIIADAAQRSLERSSGHRNRWTSMILSEPEPPSPVTSFASVERSHRSDSLPVQDVINSESQPERIAHLVENGFHEEEDDDNGNEENQELPGFVSLEDIETILGRPYVLGQDLSSFKTRLEIIQLAKARIMREEAAALESARQESVKERWRRRKFYIDEEEGVKAPEGFDPAEDVDFSQVNGHKDDYTNGTGANSPVADKTRDASSRSRSSSKVRFEDELSDAELETRSNGSVSSRNIPVGERWGGYEIPVAEQDAGKELLYRVTQQALNEIIDPVFKEKEDLAMKVLDTADERRRWASILSYFGTIKPRPIYSQKSFSESMKDDIDAKFGALWTSLSNLPQPPSYPDNPRPSPAAYDRQYGNIIPMILEEERHQTSLEDLLWSSHFLTRPADFPDDTTPSMMQRPDPTLPQNRPELPPAETTQAPSDPIEAPIKALIKAPINASVEASIEASIEPQAGNIRSKRLKGPLPEQNMKEIIRLKQLIELEVFEQEVRERGGPGRISLDEFEAFLNDHRELGFLGNWIEMGNF